MCVICYLGIEGCNSSRMGVSAFLVLNWRLQTTLRNSPRGDYMAYCERSVLWSTSLYSSKMNQSTIELVLVYTNNEWCRCTRLIGGIKWIHVISFRFKDIIYHLDNSHTSVAVVCPPSCCYRVTVVVISIPLAQIIVVKARREWSYSAEELWTTEASVSVVEVLGNTYFI
jgi:hypothetical protein